MICVHLVTNSYACNSQNVEPTAVLEDRGCMWEDMRLHGLTEAIVDVDGWFGHGPSSECGPPSTLYLFNSPPPPAGRWPAL